MAADWNRLHRRVVFGESGGRIIWQPRILCWYSDKQLAGEPLPPPYAGMTLPEIYRALGCSNRIYDYNACFRAVEHPAVRFERRELGGGESEEVIHTPAGRQTARRRQVPELRKSRWLKWPVATEEELKVAAWRAEHASWEFDPAAFERVRAEWGDLGAPTMFMPRVNVQDLYINTMGVEAGIYALLDWPGAVEAYFRALDECHDRLIDVINASPVEIINFGDNVHCGTLPPDIFRRHVLPAYQRRCRRLHRGGKFVHAHWDGDVKALLPFARQTGLDGIEAITPQPQGDVTLEEVRQALGEDMFLLDGIPAVYFDATFPPSAAEDCARRVIELFAPRLVLGISDEISSTGDLERVRAVGRIVEEYNARFPEQA